MSKESKEEIELQVEKQEELLDELENWKDKYLVIETIRLRDVNEYTDFKEAVENTKKMKKDCYIVKVLKGWYYENE